MPTTMLPITMACCLIGLSPSVALATAAETGLPTPYDNYYGVYLGGGKVGWMHASFVSGEEEAVLSVELEAQVAGMGSTAAILLREQRRYAGRGGRLRNLAFSQRADAGEVTVTGKARGDTLVLQTKAGGVATPSEVPVTETLRGALAPQALARSGNVGAEERYTHFDASVQRNVAVVHRVEAVESRLVGGIETQVVRVVSSYPDLGIEEASWIDRSGLVLETRVGGFFVARLEPRDVAKKRTYQQDLLVSAVVQVPEPIANQEALQSLTLRFSGFGKNLPPASQRQQVVQKDGGVVLHLRRDPPLARRPLSTSPWHGELAQFVEATPFVQSDAPAIRAAAIRAVGDASDLASAVARLTHFVFEHIKDEYVPAYSNALDALTSGRGDCTEHSVLFVALARALNIPARVAVGIAYWPVGHGFGWHAWAEVFDGQRWVSVDPTWNQPEADVTHVKLAGGSAAQQARIVMLLGRLKIEQLAMR